MSYLGKQLTGVNLPTLSRGQVHVQRITADGILYTYGLLTSPASVNHIDVYVNGVYRNKNTYTISGSSITFDSLITNGFVIEAKITDVAVGASPFVTEIYSVPTVSAPDYVKGGLYFDTTLNKLRVGGATDWETITSV
jgi:hypothetical protein